MKNNRNLIEKISIKDDVISKTVSKQSTSKLKQTQKNIEKEIQNIGDLTSQVQSQKNIKQINESQKDDQIEQNEQNNPKNLQQSIIHDLKNNLSEISASVSTIKSEYTALRQSESQLLMNTKISKIKQKKISKLDHPEIVSFLSKKQQQQQQREKRRLNQIAQIEKKRREQEQKRIKQKQDEKAGKISEMKKLWFVKENNMKKKQQQEFKQKNVEQIFKKYRNSIPLFEIKQKQDKEDEMRRAELVKQYLIKHKQTYMSANQPFQQKQLTEHQKRHQQKAQQLQKQKSEQKTQIYQKVQQDNEQFKNLYRGKVTQRVVSQIKTQQQKRQIPYRIKQRMKGYGQIVKQNHKPKPTKSSLRKMRSNSSSLDMKAKRDTESNLSFREIKRYKYLHGVSYGSVIQHRPLAKSFDQEKRVGNGYLQFMKSLPKKRTQKQQPIVIPINFAPKPNPLSHNRPKNSYININDEPTRQEIKMVLQQLRVNDKKIKNRQKLIMMKGSHNEESDENRRQINNELLLSVQKKMNLLSKLQKNKVNTE